MLIFKIGLFAMRKCLFWPLKVPISQRKKAYLGKSNKCACLGKPLSPAFCKDEIE